MERIVVGVGSEGGRQRALGWVIRRARQHPVSIHLVRVAEPLLGDIEAEQERLASAQEAAVAGCPGAPVTSELVLTRIPDALTQAAANADLLVLGTRRRRAIRSMLSGSLPIETAMHSRCATAIVPDDWAPTPRYRTVVTGIADDETSDRAMLFAAREAQEAGADLEALHAWMPVVPTLASPDLVVDDADQRAQHRDRLSRALERIRAAYPNTRLRGVLEEREPGLSLAEHASRGQLVVIGSHRRGALAGLLLGSSALDILRSTSEPLCIVPPAAGDRTPTEPIPQQSAEVTV